MVQKDSRSGSATWLGIAIFILTIVLAQELTNTIFPIETPTRVIAKLVLDTALIAIGLGMHHRVVGNAILYAGIIRFIFIFFQLKGMDPTIRVVVLIITILILFVVGFLKFGRNLASKEAK